MGTNKLSINILMRSFLIAANLFAASKALSVSVQQFITEPHLYTVDENGDCFDNNNDKVARQSDCCNVDPTSEERIELFKPFCSDTIDDEICHKFVYHIQTETCDRTAVDRTKYYTDATFSDIVGDPVYSSSFVLSAKGECCIAQADFPDNIEAC